MTPAAATVAKRDPNAPVLSLIGNTPLVPLRFEPEGLTLLAALRCYLVINAVTWAIPGVIDEPRALWVAGAFSLALGASYLVPSLTIIFGGLFGGVGLLILAALLARAASAPR